MPIIRGTNYADEIVGTSTADDIYGYGGNDLIYGNGGDDIIYGGAGNDDIFGGTGVNDLYGGTGADYFSMSARGTGASDDFIADFEFDRDRVDVSAWGVSDISQLRELLGTDANGDANFNASYYGENHFVTIAGVSAAQLEARDFIFDTGAARNITGTARADTLFGSRYNDTINGAGGNDYLLGGNGADRLLGGAGNDKLVGGMGRDTLNGGIGADTFIFNDAAESVGVGRDFITGFQAGIDNFDLAGIDANAIAAGNQAFRFIGTAAFTGAGQLQYTWSGGDTYISGNTDADAAPEFEIRIQGQHTLYAGDFIL